jgi:hypothetical protein
MYALYKRVWAHDGAGGNGCWAWRRLTEPEQTADRPVQIWFDRGAWSSERVMRSDLRLDDPAPY